VISLKKKGLGEQREPAEKKKKDLARDRGEMNTGSRREGGQRHQDINKREKGWPKGGSCRILLSAWV